MLLGKEEIFPGVWLLKSVAHHDLRGFFRELYRESWWSELGLHENLVQDNISYSHQGVLRGMHYHAGGGQVKVIQVLLGQTQGVVLDIRPESDTLGKHVSVPLGEDSPSILCVPKGFAYGFCVTSPHAVVHYKVSSEYAPGCLRSIFPLDADLAIPWELAAPTMSVDDLFAPTWKEYLEQSNSQEQ